MACGKTQMKKKNLISKSLSTDFLNMLDKTNKKYILQTRTNHTLRIFDVIYFTVAT